jgi:uncharacterized protein (DUF58 family)
MIVPRARLLWWVSIVVLPGALLGALVPGAAILAATVIALLLLLSILDAVRASGALEGIAVELPKAIFLFKDRAGSIDVQIKNERLKPLRLRLGLPLPRGIHSPEEDLLAVLPQGSELSRLSWPCTPARRGRYQLSQCYLEGTSPWGFWGMRRAAPVHTEIRVYPNLLTERKSVAALFLHRGGFGVHAQRQVGKGRDFEKLREYFPGDSFDDVHWKATAKRGRPVTKIFQIERTQQVYVIIDASRLSARPVVVPTSLRSRIANPENQPDEQASHPGVETTTLERFITAALILGLAAEQQGDLFGLITFSDKVEKFVRAKNGKTHYGTCRDALYTLQPQIVTPDFDEVCAFIRLRLRRRALLIFLTALDDPLLAESFVRNVDLISRQHLVLVNMMQPPGVRPLFSDPNVSSLDELYQQLGGHNLWHSLRELEKVLQRRGVTFSLLSHERLSAQLVTEYLSVKQRQLL